MQLTRGFFILLISVATARAAESESSAKRFMTLDECVQAALLHNFDVQIKRYGPELARYNLNAYYGGYDPSFSFSGEHNYSLSPGGIDQQGRSFQGTETTSDRFNSGLQGLLPWGLTYDLGGSMADQSTLRPFSITDPNSPVSSIDADPIYGTNLTSIIGFSLHTNYAGTISGVTPSEVFSGNMGFLQLRQPVLKNFWIDSTRLNIAVNKRSLRISESDLRLQIMTSVTKVEQAYYNLIFALENVKVQEKALELADRLLAENKKKVEVGALAPLDEKQAQAQVAQSRADLLSAKNTLAIQENTLKDLITDEYRNIHDTEYVPAEKLLPVPQSYNLQQSWETGLRQRPELISARLNLEKQGYVVRFQKNQLLPQVDLIGTYGYSASSSRGYGDAFDQLGHGDSPFYSAGGQLSIPLGNRAARNSYKAAKAAKEQLALQVRQLEQTVMVEIDNAVKQAQSDFERVDATRQARIYAEAALDAEQKKLENGKSTSFEVLRLQRDLTTAASQEIRALADYNNDLAQLALQEGTTLERRRLMVEVK
jgi:outer membrane protein TolC